MRFRSLTAIVVLLASFGSALADEKANAPNWQPMLAKTFKDDAKNLRVNGLVVDRKVGCVFLSVEGKGVYCASAGAKHFTPNKKTWAQVSKLRSEDLQHKFILTAGCIKESTDGGKKWSNIPAPKGFVITEQTWLQYDAKTDALYLMKSGSDLYKLSRGSNSQVAKR
jgi:hypothetical protein